MSTLGIVSLSLLAGMFLLLLLGSLGLSIYLTWQVKRKAEAIDKQNAEVYAWTKSTLTDHETQMKAVFESAKSALSSIRAEIRGGLENNFREVTESLKTHQGKVELAVTAINATALREAADRAIVAMERIESAVTLLHEITMSAPEETELENVRPMPRRTPPPPRGMTEDEYAPPTASFVGQNANMAKDAESLTEEAMDVERGA